MGQWEAEVLLEKYAKRIDREYEDYKETWQRARWQTYWTVRMAGKVSKIEREDQLMRFPWEPEPPKPKKPAKRKLQQMRDEMTEAYWRVVEGKGKPLTFEDL